MKDHLALRILNLVLFLLVVGQMVVIQFVEHDEARTMRENATSAFHIIGSWQSLQKQTEDDFLVCNSMLPKEQRMR